MSSGFQLVDSYQTNSPLVTSDYAQKSTGGSVVEFSPATQEAQVRFQASASFLPYRGGKGTY